MMKKLISCIFIYIVLVLFTSCSDNIVGMSDCPDCYLYLDAPDLVMNEDGYYEMGFLDGYIQTFSTIKAMTGIDYEKVGWMSDTRHMIEHMGQEYLVDVVNQSSYTNEEGDAYTVLGIWEESVGDTITIYAGYYDSCENQHLDSLKVIVE